MSDTPLLNVNRIIFIKPTEDNIIKSNKQVECEPSVDLWCRGRVMEEKSTQTVTE